MMGLLLREKETIQVELSIVCHFRLCSNSSRTWTRVYWKTRRWRASSAKCRFLESS